MMGGLVFKNNMFKKGFVFRSLKKTNNSFQIDK